MSINPEDQWPSVRLGFALVLPSYDWMMSRFEATRTGIQGLFSVATTTTVAVPLLAPTVSDRIDFSSPLFYAAILLYLANVCVSLRGLTSGSLRLIHPGAVYDKWLGDSNWEFMKKALAFAGDDFERNKAVVARLVTLRKWSGILLVAELLAAIWWMASGV